MSGRLIEAVVKANRTREPEHSVLFRVVVLAAVCVGALSLAAVEAVSVGTALVVVAALMLAYWVSYVRREADNWHIKIALTAAALFALVRFLGQLGGVATLDEVRFPLADLFLWVQVIHGFDLPQRRDLNFSLGSSLTLMAVAGSVSQDMTYAIFLVVYAVLAISALALSYRSSLSSGTAATFEKESQSTTSTSSRPAWLPEASRAVVTTLVAATILFLVIPQPQTVRSFALPFSLGSGLGVFSGGNPVNPGFSEGSPSSRSGAGASFHGFGQSMDLNVRGDLPDDLVMRVRATQAAMWRSGVFDRYDGRTWTGPEADPEPLPDRLPVAYPVEFRDLGPRVSISQTFYLEAELPNAIFAASQPDSVWYEGGLFIDSLGILRTASTLTPGGVYSVVSSRGAATAQQLRAAESDEVPEKVARYLQVPDSLPERVGQLAQEITRGTNNRYDQVKAMEAYLAERYRYTIESPIAPPGRDSIDHFLFDTDVGYCEQFASATAIMLRTLGVPARVAVGFTPGTRNAFTGLYEVKASDAHAWVEVWFPGLGWYEFDPTFDIPPAQMELGEVLPLARVIGFAVEQLRGFLPAGGLGILRTAMIVAIGGAAALWLVLLLRGRRRRPAPAARTLADKGQLGKAFLALEEALATAGAPRRPHETVRETIHRAAQKAGSDEQQAASVVETHLYAREGVPPEHAQKVASHLKGLARTIVQQARGTAAGHMADSLPSRS
ncbi:MAG: transglutaminase TgpA family protein [Actinomycetota bacterium]